MAEQLKPCPFCGGKASINPMHESNEDGENYGYYRVGCNTPKCCIDFHEHDTEEEAREFWNTRANPWTPVETPPKTKYYVIVVLDGDRVCDDGKMWFDVDYHVWMNNDQKYMGEDGVITHWMYFRELPLPPAYQPPSTLPKENNSNA